MKDKMNYRDYELISAYLDNQLSSNDRALFEERLKANPELEKELNEISSTRLMLRRLPRQRVPRNFFVTAQAVQRRPTLKLAPIFGIVSAAASVLLALVIFGSTFVPSTHQTAMAPAAVGPTETIVTQQEIARSVAAAPITPTEAPPAVGFGAGMGTPIQASPSSTPFLPELSVVQPEISTPTTIYINVYPPPTTPENPFSIAEAPTETPIVSCDEYFQSVPLPQSDDIYNCPTPTGTLSKFLESILATSTATPTYSPTLTSTPTSTLAITPPPTETPLPTETPTPTATPAPIATFNPTDTAAPSLLQAPQQAQKSVPSGITESSTETTPPNQLLGAVQPTQVAQAPAQAPTTPANYSFLSYLLLTVEISLAVIAILAGITAIILRIRAR